MAPQSALKVVSGSGAGIVNRAEAKHGAVGRTRIHLDEVEGLGDFLELEVVLREGGPTDAGVREAEVLMARLQVQPSQLIDRAYVDLMARKELR